MKQIVIIALFFSFLIWSCSPAVTPTPLILSPTEMPAPTNRPAATQPPPTNTPIPEVWSELKLVTGGHPLEYTNPTDNYNGAPIYQSQITLDVDTRWQIKLETGKLQEDIGEASTGLLITGYNEKGEQPVLFWVYQSGGWNLGYAPIAAPEYTFGQFFDQLKSPAQQFEITISNKGKTLSITNDAGFTFTHTFAEALFSRAQYVQTEVQFGPHSTLRVSDLAIYQRQRGATVTSLPTPQPAGSDYQYILHVSSTGDDSNPGTPEKPLATMERARDVIRLLNQTMVGDIQVVLHSGVYPITQPIQFGEIDSGMNGHQVIYRAAEGEQPILSGGINVTNWEKVPGGELWKATLTDQTNLFRQLYINDIRAQRAVSEKTITGLRYAPGKDGIIVAAGKIPVLARPQDLELHWIYDWKDIRLKVRTVETNPDGTQTIWMLQPYYALALGMDSAEHKWIPGFDIPFSLENAPELLDQPGEWYYNPESHELFYWPRPGEDLKAAEAVIPQYESLLEVRGGALGQEVHDLAFEGLTFAYAGWTRASEVGTFGWQAQNLINTDRLEMTPAHVHLSASHNLRLEKNRFIHLGASALGLGNNTENITVQGNLFYDISDAAIVVGHWDDAYITVPNAQVQPKNNLLANNRIDQAGAEYWGAAGINAYYVENLQIVHNQLSNLPYTGISLGWGWSSTTDSITCQKNRVANNLITDLILRARDAGGIYTLGQQPGTVVEGNVMRRMQGDYGCLYPDEGSAFITYRDNVCDTAPYWLHLWINTIHDIDIQNTSSNVTARLNNGVRIKIVNTVPVTGQNWPPEALKIMENAGLEPEFQYLNDWLKALQNP